MGRYKDELRCYRANVATHILRWSVYFAGEITKVKSTSSFWKVEFPRLGSISTRFGMGQGDSIGISAKYLHQMEPCILSKTSLRYDIVGHWRLNTPDHQIHSLKLMIYTAGDMI